MPFAVHLRRSVITLGAAVVIAMAFATPPIHASSFPVTKTADSNDGACDADCSLREAVVAANAAPGADVITVPAGTYTLGGAGGEDLAASGDLDLRESVTIIGAGDDATILDGGGVDRLFDIVETATVTITALTLRNGRVPAGDTRGGGAILWGEPFSGKTLDLTLDGLTITGNDAGDGDGGGLRIDQEDPGSSVVRIIDSTIADSTMIDGDGGGLHLCCENLTVTISGSTVTGNTAVEDPTAPGTNGEGGGIYHCCTDTTLTIVDSTISDNTGPTNGGGLFTCCGVETNALATLERSTVSGNVALGPAALQGFGGGIAAEGAVTLVNSTLSGNRARQDGGGIENEDVVSLTNVTLAGNQAGRGGGLFEDGAGITLVNTLLAGNLASGNPENCAATVGTDPLVSHGGNLSSDATCALAGLGDRQSLDPLLGPLADDGGPTETHLLVAASPAVDGGTNTACPVIDQRGRPRPADGDDDGNATCDVGAVERDALGEDCDNGADDNTNGLVDCEDFACAGQPLCAERCTNCVDDDGDGASDRDDSDCPTPSDGGGAGVGNHERGTRVTACAATLQRIGARLAATHLKTLQRCVGGLFACVQRKPGNGRCLTTRGDRCRTGLAKLEQTAGRAQAAAVEACNPLTASELRDAAGLGYLAEASPCAGLGVAALDDAAGIAACVAAQHACAAQQLVGIEMPRARELLGLGGLDPATALSCAFAPVDGGGAGLGTSGRTATVCLQTIQKAGAKLVTRTMKLAQTCAGAVGVCQQRKPTDPRCLAKARVACPKAFAKIIALESKLAAAVDRKCNVATLALAGLLSSTGAGFQSQASLCEALGVPALDSTAAVGTCVTRQHQCLAQQMLERELPRLRELLGAGGVALP